MIYLDYAADTPVCQQALDAFYSAARLHIANPNAAHPLGVTEKELFDDATAHIAARLGVLPAEIVYTSGASESNNLAIKGIAGQYKKYGRHIITTMLEHSSVIGPVEHLRAQGFAVDYVRLLPDGRVDTGHLLQLLREDTILVSVCLVDSELGIVQDIASIAAALAAYPRCRLHVDASQAVGKLPIAFDAADLVTLTPHKFYGLTGCGLLVVKEGVLLESQIHGGLSSSPFRSGTPSAAFACSTAAALEAALAELHPRLDYVRQLAAFLRGQLCVRDGIRINSPEGCSPFILNISVAEIKPEAMVHTLGQKGVCIASKSACCAPGSLSRPVYALTNDRKAAMSTLRISLSHLTTEQELSEFLRCLDKCRALQTRG